MTPTTRRAPTRPNIFGRAISRLSRVSSAPQPSGPSPSSPLGAELSIDGHRAGTTPTVVQMMGFAAVNLTFTKQGFQSVTRKVYSKLAQDRVFVKLPR